MVEIEEVGQGFKPYLPRLLIDWLRETPTASSKRIEGSLAFVDVSGFTKMSERLARRGKVGAEEVTDIIGTSFARLLEAAYEEGGSLIKFGGDALLLFFTGEEHGPSACRAAAAMRKRIREIGDLQTSAGLISLRMSVGIHSGKFNFFLAGTLHRELIITGPAATQTVAMESMARSGDIVISPATAASLPRRSVGSSVGSGFLLRGWPPGIPRPQREPDPGGLDLSTCVPVAIRRHLAGGGSEPEHRRATVSFLHFDGVDDMCEGPGLTGLVSALETLIGRIQDEAALYEVCFLGTDIDRDGGKIILVAGAPQAAGNDEERMLRAVRAIMDDHGPLPLRAGVNRGPVFAGDIGPPYRRTYTVMGDAVNLAARLMQAAQPGQILTTESVLRLSRSRFEEERLEPLVVKGKARPIDAYLLGRMVETGIDERAQRGPLMGREAEVKMLLAAADSARAGDGRVVELVGEPGIGKSRLLEELRTYAVGMSYHTATCNPYDSSTPYFAIRGVLRELLGLSEHARAAEAGRRLTDVVGTVAPELLAWLPLLAIPIDAEVAPSPETEQLDERFRRARLEQATDALMAKILPGPAVLVFEDAHWMDEASSDLLRLLSGTVGARPWLICATRQELDSGFAVGDRDGTVSIRLGPLDPGDLATLAWLATEDAPLSPHEISALAERAGGNPLFLEELLEVARAGSEVDALPDSVEALVTSRIDRLPPRDRIVLRSASVLGASFDEDLLEAVLPAYGGGDDPIWTRLGEFITRSDGGTVRFRHALFQEAAYEGLPYRSRRELHARAGEMIEKVAGTDSDDQAELLSLHFFHAQRHEEAWRYSTVAGDRAKGIYANVEAAEFYQRALEAARHRSGRSPADLARVSEALGDVRKLIGLYEGATTAYRAGRRLVPGSPLDQARLLLKQARAQQEAGRYRQALHSITRGLRVLEGEAGEAEARQRGQLAVGYASVRQEQGRHREAIRWCQRAIDEAMAAGDQEALAQAYYLLDWAYVDLGEPEKASYSEQALAIYRELGDLWRQAVVLNNMGAFAYWEGRWESALELYERAREAWRKTGDEVNAAYGTGNIAEILSDRGSLREAESLFHQALRVWRAAEHRSTVASATSQLGRVASRSGRYDEAMRLLEEARTLARDVGAEGEVLETDARITEYLVLQGEAEEAIRLADSALAQARTFGGVAAQSPLLHRNRGYALMQLRSMVEARAALEESLRLARSRKASYEVALTLQALMNLDRLEGRPPRPEMEAESRSILDGLGVVSIPAVPLPQPVG
jgi:class 3 adenylate cyclase/tetratricopeptide (TPR) repeat protein